MSDRTVAMIVENCSNKGRICMIIDFEGSSQYDMIGFNSYETWRQAAKKHFKILKVRRTVDV